MRNNRQKQHPFIFKVPVYVLLIWICQYCIIVLPYINVPKRFEVISESVGQKFGLEVITMDLRTNRSLTQAELEIEHGSKGLKESVLENEHEHNSNTEMMESTENTKTGINNSEKEAQKGTDINKVTNKNEPETVGKELEMPDNKNILEEINKLKEQQKKLQSLGYKVEININELKEMITTNENLKKDNVTDQAILNENENIFKINIDKIKNILKEVEVEHKAKFDKIKDKFKGTDIVSKEFIDRNIEQLKEIGKGQIAKFDQIKDMLKDSDILSKEFIDKNFESLKEIGKGQIAKFDQIKDMLKDSDILSKEFIDRNIEQLKEIGKEQKIKFDKFREELEENDKAHKEIFDKRIEEFIKMGKNIISKGDMLNQSTSSLDNIVSSNKSGSKAILKNVELYKKKLLDKTKNNEILEKLKSASKVINNMKDQIGSYVKDQTGNAVKGEKGSDVKNEKGSDVKDKTGSDVKDKTGSDVKNEKVSDVKNEKGSDVKDKTGSDVKDQTGSDVKDKTSSDVKDGKNKIPEEVNEIPKVQFMKKRIPIKNPIKMIDSFIENKIFRIFEYVDDYMQGKDMNIKDLSKLRIKKEGRILILPTILLCILFLVFINPDTLWPSFVPLAVIEILIYIYIIIKIAKYIALSNKKKGEKVTFKDYMDGIKKCL